MRAIVKVQVALASSDGGPPEIYTYDKDRKHPMLAPLTDYIAGLMGNRVKAYFLAEWTGYGWRVTEQVEDQDW